jgi:hypothetical protein
MSEEGYVTKRVSSETALMFKVIQAAAFCWFIVYVWKIASAGSRGLDMLFDDMHRIQQFCASCMAAI